MQKLLLAVSLVIAGSAAQAQVMTTPSGGATSAATPAPGIQNQADNVTDTFAGLTIQIQRLIRDPQHENGYRLILRVIETDTTGRRVAWVQPAATVVDDMGNIYQANQSTGVPICRHREIWDVDTGYCAYHNGGTPVILTPSQPMQTVMLFVPAENGFAAELASLASTASFKARVAIYSADMSTNSYHDVVINGIALPQEGS